MLKKTKLRPRLVWFAAVVLAFGSFSARAEVADPLDLPAKLTTRATQLVQLAVARAGSRLVSVGERGTVLLSDDNGNNWRQARVPVSVTLTSVWFVTERFGWAVGHSGVVLNSADGGETWSKQLDGKQAAQLVFAEAKASAGTDAASQRRVSEAERLVAEGADKPFLDVHFLDERNGLIVGAYGLIFSTDDGGKTWRSLANRTENPRNNHLYAVRPAGSDWYIAGEQGLLLRSTDGAMSFSQVQTPYGGTYFGLLFGSDNELLIYGLRGNVFWSGDSGANWIAVDTGLPASLNAGTRLSDGSLVIVDEAGRVLQSRDAGRSFAPVLVPQPSPFTGIVQSADGNLIVSGVRGVIRLVTANLMAKPGGQDHES
jgi:photosystem II stability/assembly factor-like uncharacterized protein